MSNFKNNKMKLVESLKRLDFAVAELIQNKLKMNQMNEFNLPDLERENLELKKKMEILFRENQNLKKINSQFASDLDSTIKITENIIIRLKNENQSES